ncbi:MAG: hypothetical protein HWN66_09975 [Candidatus Helarchaeota archaeon]|nr:hypothetical protein [Candidatus Helarchaeota archaeon]
MGKEKVPKQAEELGFTKFRMTILYARPQNISIRQRVLTRYIPDVIYDIRDYIARNDSSLIEEMVGTKNVTAYYLAQKMNLYVVIFDKAAFWTIMNPAKHALQINIFSNNEEHVRGIANVVNHLWVDGILAHMDWKWIEKKYKVDREDCIATWKEFL